MAFQLIFADEAPQQWHLHRVAQVILASQAEWATTERRPFLLHTIWALQRDGSPLHQWAHVFVPVPQG